jgi:hypothetical protein
MDIDRLLEPLGFLRDIQPNRLYGQLRDVPRLMFGGFMTLKSKKNFGFLGISPCKQFINCFCYWKDVCVCKQHLNRCKTFPFFFFLSF